MQAAIAAIAKEVSFPIVQIPLELQDMDACDAVHHRLQMHVQAIGGYEALAGACPRYRASIWRSKIERSGRYTLSVDDFQKLIHLFDDLILVALLGKDHCLIDLRNLRAIPSSEYSLADLVWALRRYIGMGAVLTCDWRETMLDGEECTSIRADMLQLLKETSIVLHQISVALDGKRASSIVST